MAGVPGQRSGGHNRKSTQHHRAAGTYREDRHGEFETPDPPRGLPVPPLKLRADEQREWDRMIARLTKAGTLTEIEDGALLEYVQLFSETQDLRRDRHGLNRVVKQLNKEAKRLQGDQLLEATGRIVELHKEKTRLVQRLRMQHMAMMQMIGRFGLTPVDRNRVKVTKPKEVPKAGKLVSYLGGKSG